MLEVSTAGQELIWLGFQNPLTLAKWQDLRQFTASKVLLPDMPHCKAVCIVESLSHHHSAQVRLGAHQIGAGPRRLDIYVCNIYSPHEASYSASHIWKFVKNWLNRIFALQFLGPWHIERHYLKVGGPEEFTKRTRLKDAVVRKKTPFGGRSP